MQLMLIFSRQCLFMRRVIFFLGTGIFLLLYMNCSAETNSGSDMKSTAYSEFLEKDQNTVDGSAVDNSAVDNSSVIHDFQSPSNVVFHPHRPLVYTVNTGDDSISVCLVDKYGNFSSCENAAHKKADFKIPFDMVINAAGTMAYISNIKNHSISRCKIDETGWLVSCGKMSNKQFVFPFGVALNNRGNTLFICNNSPDRETARVSRCSLGSDGTLTSCAYTGGKMFKHPAGIALNAANTLGFVTDLEEGIVYRCDMDKNGQFSHCENTGGKNFSNPVSVALSADERKAFIANFGGTTVTRCDVNKSGYFSGCRDSGANGFSTPYGLAVKGNIGFISNVNHGRISRCDINADGSFSTCRDSQLPIVMNSDSELLSTINLRSNTSGDIRVVNLGAAVFGMEMKIPPLYARIFTEKSSCPINREQPLAGDHDCTVHYNLPGSVSSTGFNLNLLKDRQPVLDIPVNVSNFIVTKNGAPAGNQIALQRGEVGTITFRTDWEVRDLQLKFNDSLWQPYFRGTCLASKQLNAGSSCTLDYRIPHHAVNMPAMITVYSGARDIYHLPLAAVSTSDIFGAENYDKMEGISKYNKKTLVLANHLDRPITNLQVKLTGSPLLRVVKNECGRKLGEGATCSVILLAGPVKPDKPDKSGKSVHLSAAFDEATGSQKTGVLELTSNESIPLSLPIRVDPVKEADMFVKNGSAFVLKAGYPKVDKNNKIGRTDTGPFVNPNTRKIRVALINAPEFLPGKHPLDTRVRLHAEGGKTVMQQTCDGGHIKCTNTSLAPHCFFDPDIAQAMDSKRNQCAREHNFPGYCSNFFPYDDECPKPIMPPEKPAGAMTVENKGAFNIWVDYPAVDGQGNIVKRHVHSFPSGNTRHFIAALPDAISSLPRKGKKQKNIRIKALAGPKRVFEVCDGGFIKCVGSTSRMRCHFEPKAYDTADSKRNQCAKKYNLHAYCAIFGKGEEECAALHKDKKKNKDEDKKGKK